MSKDKTTPETDIQILDEAVRKPNNTFSFTRESMLKAIEFTRLSERTRIMEEGLKLGLPNDAVKFAKEIIGRFSRIETCDWDNQNWLVEGIIQMRDQASLILSSQRIEAERRAVAFADWILKNDYSKIHGDRWVKKWMSVTHSSSELYTIFETWYGEQKKKQEEKNEE